MTVLHIQSNAVILMPILPMLLLATFAAVIKYFTLTASKTIVDFFAAISTFPFEPIFQGRN